MDLGDLSGNERLVAEQSVLAYRAMVRAGAAAPPGRGMAALEGVAVADGYESVRRMVELSAAEHAEAQKGGPAAGRARAPSRRR